MVTGTVLPKAELLRFALSPDDVVVPDVKAALPGRGMWITPSRKVLEEAIRKNHFARSAKQSVKLPEGLADRTEYLLRERALAYLKRARMAGHLAVGYEKLATALRKESVRVLIHAEDAADDGTRKLNGMAFELPVIAFCPREVLAEALGLPNPVHMGITDDALGRVFLSSYERWAGFIREDTV